MVASVKVELAIEHPICNGEFHLKRSPSSVGAARLFRDQVRITLGDREACDPRAIGICGPIPR